MTITLLFLFGTVLLLVAIELILRNKYGLGTPPLYIADEYTGIPFRPQIKKLDEKNNNSLRLIATPCGVKISSSGVLLRL